MNEVTHSLLEDKAVAFLRRNIHCTLVNKEVPSFVKYGIRKKKVIMDVVGVQRKAFNVSKYYIIECKVTYEDFNDKKRLMNYRRYPRRVKKYFLCPRKVILESHLRKKGLSSWGLLYLLKNGSIEVIKDAR